MVYSVILLIFISAPLLGQSLSPKIDPKKFTVCAITINSDNEKKVFQSQIKKYPQKFNPIVELTDFSEKNDWFEKACSSGIRCDQLVISGHFGGSFFGDSGNRLGLDELESFGCSKKCEGILSNPYEVFLFGCNTLSTRERDHRTPTQYLQVLLDDGIPRMQAELVVESRYGNIGEDHKSKMKRAFGGEKKQLYGFDSVGPSGKNVEGFLNNYFTKINPVDQLEKLRAKRMFNKVDFLNHSLANSLKTTAFTQCTAGSTEEDKNTSIICALKSDLLTVDAKLEIVIEAMASEEYLSFIPAINDFLNAHPITSLTTEQKSRIDILAKNERIKNQILALLNNSQSLSLTLEWSSLATSLGFINTSDKKDLINARLNEMFREPISNTNKDLICSLPGKLALLYFPDPNLIKNRKLSHEDFIALACLGVQNKEIQLKIADEYIADQSHSADWALKKIKPHDKEILLKLINFSKKNNYFDYPLIIEILSNTKVDNEVLLHLVEDISPSKLHQGLLLQLKDIFKRSTLNDTLQIKLLECSKDPQVLNHCIDALSYTKHTNPKIQLQLATIFGNGLRDSINHYSIAKTFKEIFPTDPEIQYHLSKMIDHPGSDSLIELFTELKPKDKKVQLQLTMALGRAEFRDKALEMFKNINPTDKEVQLRIVPHLKDHVSGTRRLALRAVSEFTPKDSEVQLEIIRTLRGHHEEANTELFIRMISKWDIKDKEVKKQINAHATNFFDEPSKEKIQKILKR